MEFYRRMINYLRGHGKPSGLRVKWRVSVQPRLGVNGDWGGIITFDLQNIVNPPKKKK